MSESTEEEILKVLNQSSENIEFEEALDPTNSPLNQPIAEGEIGDNSKPVEVKTEPINKGEYVPPSEGVQESSSEPQAEMPAEDNVPEQEIGSGEFNESDQHEFPRNEFKIPESHANQAADTILGITDNILAVGGGFFVKIKKHKEFYEFDEVIQIIEEQNDKNVKRLKLDEDDKALLRPLISLMLKEKAQVLTPQQQMLGAVLSILMKKGQMVMEIKAENEILVDRILDVIAEAKGETRSEVEPENTPSNSEQETVVEEEPVVEEVEVIDESVPNEVLEVSDNNE